LTNKTGDPSDLCQFWVSNYALIRETRFVTPEQRLNERQQLLQEILLDACEIADAEKRAAFLTEACAADATLRRDIEELLQANEAAGKFLPEIPAVPCAFQRAALPGEGSDEARPTATAQLTEKPGDRIGRYKLLQKLGEGGCGLVYMAEQEEPVRRKVALKVIKLGMDTKNVVARFGAERQALALMDHPHIARVLDAGATATGRPFFV
jgi:hypothetical protein